MLLPELLEMINTNINLYKTCKGYYVHKKIFYKEFVIDINNNLKYQVNNPEIKHGFLRFTISDDLLNYMKSNTYQMINYNQPVVDFSNLTHITFDERFNQPIIKLPDTLIYLEFGNYFNQPLTVPPILKYLTLGHYFDKPLELPNTLKYLTLGARFRQLFNFPKKLKYIKMPEYYDIMIDVNTIPKGIEFYIGDNLINF